MERDRRTDVIFFGKTRGERLRRSWRRSCRNASRSVQKNFLCRRVKKSHLLHHSSDYHIPNVGVRPGTGNSHGLNLRRGNFHGSAVI
eukprot:scaffold32166_cov73-Skeletonema_marinoi.AAC.1